MTETPVFGQDLSVLPSPFLGSVKGLYPSFAGQLTYLLTPCSTALLEKPTGFQLVKKFPAFYGTRRFITAFTSARHLPPGPGRSSPYPHIPLPEDPS